MRKIACLMGLFPNEYYEEIQKYTVTGLQNAANKLQWGIVKGLDQNGADVTVINSLYVGSYPKRFRLCKIPSFGFQHCPGAKDRNIGFNNLMGIKNISRFFTSKKAVDEWIKNENGREIVIYALTIPFALVSWYIKKRYPQTRVCYIVPDLPEYMDVGRMKSNTIYRMAKRISSDIIRKCVQTADCFVLLTEQMKEWFGYPVSYVVMEGIADTESAAESVEPDMRKKQIIYAGGIRYEYGIGDLVQAFARIENEEWELVIFGDGIDAEQIENQASRDRRIRFMGAVPNSTVLHAQKHASLLINPRKNQDMTKYSFPSKTLEYMLSGTPMLGYKLEGIPEEYSEYYFQISEAEDGLYSSLKKTMEFLDEERLEKGKRAKEFVCMSKNPKIQVKKILDILDEIDS